MIEKHPSDAVNVARALPSLKFTDRDSSSMLEVVFFGWMVNAVSREMFAAMLFSC